MASLQKRNDAIGYGHLKDILMVTWIICQTFFSPEIYEHG